MIQLENELCFVLKRSPYKENQYLIDIFAKNYGLIRAVARTSKKKTHRETEHLAPFREIRVSGQQKRELASLWQSEIHRHYPLNGKQWLTASYLNDLLLNHCSREADIELYEQYKKTLAEPSAENLRHIEWHLIKNQGLLPERLTDSAYYQLTAQQQDWLTLTSSEIGFAHELVIALENDELPLTHPQLKQYLQTLLRYQNTSALRSKNTALALLNLIKH